MAIDREAEPLLGNEKSKGHSKKRSLLVVSLAAAVAVLLLRTATTSATTSVAPSGPVLEEIAEPPESAFGVPGCGCSLQTCCDWNDKNMTGPGTCSVFSGEALYYDLDAICDDVKAGGRPGGISVCDMPEFKKGGTTTGAPFYHNVMSMMIRFTDKTECPPEPTCDVGTWEINDLTYLIPNESNDLECVQYNGPQPTPTISAAYAATCDEQTGKTSIPMNIVPSYWPAYPPPCAESEFGPTDNFGISSSSKRVDGATGMCKIVESETGELLGSVTFTLMGPFPCKTTDAPTSAPTTSLSPTVSESPTLPPSESPTLRTPEPTAQPTPRPRSDDATTAGASLLAAAAALALA